MYLLILAMLHKELKQIHDKVLLLKVRVTVFLYDLFIDLI